MPRLSREPPRVGARRPRTRSATASRRRARARARAPRPRAPPSAPSRCRPRARARPRGSRSFDVVAQAELERAAHLLELVRAARARRRAALRSASRGASSTLGGSGAPPARARARAGGRRAAAGRSPSAGSTSTTRSASSNPGARASTSPSSSSTTRVAVEDELVLAADERCRTRRSTSCRARGRRASPRARGLADVERRGGDVRRQLGAGKRQVGRGRARLPDVLADRRSDERLAETQQHELAAGREVAVLVEDAVVRQELLAVDALTSPSASDGAGVVEIAIEVRRADERGDPVRLAGDRSSDASAARTNAGRSSRSSGG